MFEDVTAMEKEIEAFRKNVVASSELVEGISDLTAVTKQQQEDFSARSAELLDKMDKCIAQFKADHEAALTALSKENAETLTALQEKLAAEQTACVSETKVIQNAIEKCAADSEEKSGVQIKKLSEECDRLITQMQTAIQIQQDAYITELSKTSLAIKDYQASLEKSYEDFRKTLQDTTVEQILKEVRDFKKNVQAKFMILLGGVGVTLVIAILGLVLK